MALALVVLPSLGPPLSALALVGLPLLAPPLGRALMGALGERKEKNEWSCG